MKQGSNAFFTYSNELKEVFPECISDNLTGLQEAVVSRFQTPTEPLATCRYEDCQSAHLRSSNSIIHWKSTIAEDDLDYKGFFIMLIKLNNSPKFEIQKLLIGTFFGPFERLMLTFSAIFCYCMITRQLIV
jgi:hypothetical protein